MEVITYIAAVLATLVLFLGESSANGAPQEASVAALAAAMTIIPYAITGTLQRRSLLDELRKSDVTGSVRK
jgi:hypothetical protein